MRSCSLRWPEGKAWTPATASRFHSQLAHCFSTRIQEGIILPTLQMKQLSFWVPKGVTPWGREWLPTPSSLAWKNPMDTEAPGGLQSMRSQRGGHN